jgi:diguanylate cyclase (GGDEF)-like protein
MSQVHLATVKDGQIQLINPVLLPEGTKILVTLLESENNPQTVGDWEQWLLFEETSQHLQSEEYLDSFTKIGNHRYFQNYLAQSWQQHKARSQPIALILIDIDFFQLYNYKYGDEQANDYLVVVAQCIANVPKRPMSVVARYGRDEFAVILPNTTIDDALILAESIRNAVSSLAIPNSGYYEEVGSYLTISLGVASLVPSEETILEDFMQTAERAVFRAKDQGGDQVFTFDLDQLTQVDSRRCFNSYLEKVWQHTKRKKQPLSLILINVDYFKQYNDNYGYEEGDKCLVIIAKIITKATKNRDYFRDYFIARYGEDEFALLLLDTNIKEALIIAESIKQAIADLAIPHGRSPASDHVTVSMGVATLIPYEKNDARDLIRKADRSLFDAQRIGRRDKIMSLDLELDGLTHLVNRRCFDDYLTQVWQQQKIRYQPIALILIDIDYFNKYNGQYGHGKADKCLIRIAQGIAKLPQISANLIARFWGDGFAVILPNTKMDNALIMAESIREAVLALAILHSASDVSDYVTISLGVATFIPSEKNSPDDLIKTADIALYRVKMIGRNQVFALDLDELTQLANRQSFDNYLAKNWQHHQRLNLPVALILVTVDYFKKYQEHYGNEEADNCLVSIAQAIAELCERNYKRLVARYDEDTFSIILPNTNPEDALVIAESIKKAAVSLAIPNASYPKAGSFVSVNLGIASLIPSSENILGNLINAAAISLLTLKNKGYDQIFSTNLDELVQHNNCQYFREYLTQEWQKHQSINRPLALILVDIAYMDTYFSYHELQNNDGLQKTNDYLIDITKMIAKTLKDQPHIIARCNEDNIGGEFAILLPNTNLEEALVLAQSIKTSIQSLPPFPIPSYGIYGVDLYMTKRLGVSSLIPSPENVSQDLIKEANRFFLLNQYGQHDSGSGYSSDFNGFTTLPNRQGLYNYLAPLWQQDLENQQSIILILANIDFLKILNDIYGHQGGDQCILCVAQAIDQLFKKQHIVGFVAHYEGGIFSIILPESDLNQASTLAELIRTEIMSLAIPVSPGSSIKSIIDNRHALYSPFLMTDETFNENFYVTYVTVSLGITQLIPNSENCPNDLFKKIGRAHV